MADLIDLTALKPPTTILAPTDSSGAIKTTSALTGTAGKDTLSGALTANTYKEIISLSVSGSLKLAGVKTLDTTSRTIGLKIVIDGTTVFDSVTAAIAVTLTGFTAVGNLFGNIGSNAAGIALEDIRFNASLSISIKSSISETDKISLLHLTAV